MVSSLMYKFSIVLCVSKEIHATVIFHNFARKVISLKKYLSAYLKDQARRREKLQKMNDELEIFHDDTGPYDDDGEPE